MKQAGILPARMGKSGNPLIAALRPSDFRLEIEVYPELEGTTLYCRVIKLCRIPAGTLYGGRNVRNAPFSVRVYTWKHSGL